MATAEWIGAWGLTEANTGSDALRMQTTAVLDGDEYVLNDAEYKKKQAKIRQEEFYNKFLATSKGNYRL